MKSILTLAIMLVLGSQLFAQYDHFDQERLTDLVLRQTAELDSIDTDINYAYHIVEDSTKIMARVKLYRKIGGKENKELIQLLNRNAAVSYLSVGDTLILPDRFDQDLRAYSPFPLYYIGGRDFPKLAIIDKSIQAFAAYEYGALKHWSVINSGGSGTPTPSGRYNFNFRDEYRISSLSPKFTERGSSEIWEMYWVVNFHKPRGMHTHQYQMPTGAASSHGCVRMMNADAEWLYNWADTWQKRGDTIIKQGTMLLILGESGTEAPSFYREEADGPVLKRVTWLPDDPYSIEPGTGQQVLFDRKRRAQMARLRAEEAALQAEEEAAIPAEVGVRY